MTRRLTEFKNLIRVTLWVDQIQWSRFAKAVGKGNRSEMIRQHIDRIVARETNKGLKAK